MEVDLSRSSPAKTLLLLLGCLAAYPTCRSSKPTRRESASAAPHTLPSAEATRDGGEDRKRSAVTISLLKSLADCDIHQDGGLMVDLGVANSTTPPSTSSGTSGDAQVSVIDRAGSTFLPVNDRRFRHEFWLDEPIETYAVRARVAGRAATSLSISVDSHRLGRAKLARNAISLINLNAGSEQLEAGRHTLTLEAHGRATPSEPMFEVDWIQFRRFPTSENGDAAPTLRDIMADQEIDGTPRRSIVLRTASKVRCQFHLSGTVKLDLALGFWGSGRGTADIRVVEEGKAPVTLVERKVAGGNGGRWTPLSLDMSEYSGRVIALELRANSATQGGRVVFGEPTLTTSKVSASALPIAKTVVVIVAAGLERRLVPPWGPIADRSAFVDLRRDAIAFDGYRVPTTLPAGVIASLLTAVSPMVHKVEDTAARLSHSTRTIGELIKQAGGRTAMYTGVPSTFAAMGFNAGWDEYGAYSPVLDLSAETPIMEATRWLARELDQHDRSTRFVFVHTRGAHPPWDLTKEQSAQLEPADYGGPLDARRAGIALGRMRRQTAKLQRRLSDEDLVRLRSSMAAAFAHQVAAMGQLIETLRRRNAWDDTLFIFAGDTTSGDSSGVPFDPLGSLREEQLTVPLLVKFPKRLHGGESFAGTVTTVDLARTILESVGLPATESMEGVGLLDAIAGLGSPQSRTFVATLGSRYVSRTGIWLLSQERGRPPKLCQTDIDPMCVEDRFGQLPLTSHALSQWTTAEILRLQRTSSSIQREPASIDPETAAALTVWGDVEM
ncbi:MAG TPA: sulfatase-like hydrolase/transferase [Polyangiaceae bacterium]